jgi:integral membrane sensor domain MASE1
VSASPFEQALADAVALFVGPAVSATGLGPVVGAVVAAAIKEAPEVVDEVEKIIAAWKSAKAANPPAQVPLDFKDQSQALEDKLHHKG